jgi:hypothetical protein
MTYIQRVHGRGIQKSGTAHTTSEGPKPLRQHASFKDRYDRLAVDDVGLQVWLSNDKMRRAGRLSFEWLMTYFTLYIN